jgi:heme/copper-type cytochrome/quinol oxidase subunit 3
MTEPRTVNVAHLEPYEFSASSPLFAGQILLCVIEGVMFFILIGVYFYLRLGVDVWPPPGIKAPNQLIPTIALLPLLASGYGSYLAGEAAKRNDRSGMIWGMALNLAFASTFLALRAYEWSTFNFTWASDAYGSIVWSILFLHTYDVVSDLILTLVLLIVVIIRRYGERERLGIYADGGLWYFLMLLWVPLYVVIYWGNYLVGGAR